MSLKEDINKALDEMASKYPRIARQLLLLREDKELDYTLEISNSVTIHRLGYNDHGKVHAAIVAFNAMKALYLLYKKGLTPTLMREYKKARFEDSLEVVMTAGFIHDIGNAISRENHELLGIILAKNILTQCYPKITEINERKKKLIMEGILCHMGAFRPTSLEAKVIPLADSCDMEKGRARIAYELGKKDIHSLSALAIKKVRIKEGEKKPLKINVEMDSSAGIFQIEELLLKKIKAAGIENLVEISANILSRKETIHYLLE